MLSLNTLAFDVWWCKIHEVAISERISVLPREVVEPNIWCKVQKEQLSSDPCMKFVEVPSAGAVVLFSGNVRDHSDGRVGVTTLVYEAYDEQVLSSFVAIATDAFSRYEGLCKIVIHHRLGECALAESTVLVVVSAEHRDSCFEAARFCIDTLKVTSPIWKKEHWSEGADWALGASEIKRFEEL